MGNFNVFLAITSDPLANRSLSPLFFLPHFLSKSIQLENALERYALALDNVANLCKMANAVATIERKVTSDLYLWQVCRQLVECRPIVEVFSKKKRAAKVYCKKNEAAKTCKEEACVKDEPLTKKAISYNQKKQELTTKLAKSM
ncbi:hypothetical protein PHLCEN_2v4914 [Hermanssonia centrifuga]|uniref:Uncharacterized protein n=1 Tax=Hermanssonia centrifuga TaxID=98765 RepID=A0A2R6PFZ1_9APHY|nr:hypothetical protein PHLCEN_2v4914 [Hermanssonia centrifuga]